MHRVLALTAVVALAACGGKEAASPAEAKLDLDSDPLALLPGSALVVASVDARAMFASARVGPPLAALADSLLPFGADAGFDAKRDVDRVVLGVYTSTGADAVAVVSGRFDAGKIAATTQTRGGAAIAHARYAGEDTCTAGPLMVSVLTAKTAVAGTGDAVRRLLERVHDRKVERAMPAWAAETLATPGAEVALAADFTTQPVAAAAIGSVPLPWLTGMRVAKVIGNFESPGMNVAATVSYGEDKQADDAADGVRAADVWLKLLGGLLGGVSVEDLEVKTEGKDLKCTFAVDDATLARVLSFAPHLIGAPP
ncbi:MAG TPA: hypothetical protein VHS09_08150 [Polyangiaceae bacterium]|jgi:hypothetical protein|nr:hypothetical protein [Polyangiaceae bacterium]